ncbi:hypothetical protein K501DRAFT_253306 [Backusella circina FSU 941]|nr:hypothetical protein K501DRAFT_253306 [Backusella circina FSU 941]
MDLNWCTFCDNAVNPFSESLYCSEQCLRADALRNHPLLGYTYPEFTDFPRPKPLNNSNSSIQLLSSPSSPKLSYSNSSSVSTSPALTATSSRNSTCSSIQLSPPKFDLLSSRPQCNDSNNKTSEPSYFSIFAQQHQLSGI